jgi:hypothetical protein
MLSQIIIDHGFLTSNVLLGHSCGQLSIPVFILEREFFSSRIMKNKGKLWEVTENS